MLCSECHKNPAVIYVNVVETNDIQAKRKKTIGLCAQCAKKRGVKVPTSNDIIQSMNNLTPEEMEEVSQKLSGIFNNLDFSKFSSMMGEMPIDGFDTNDFMYKNEIASENAGESAQAITTTQTKVKDKKASKKLKYLDVYATNLTQLAKDNKLDKVIGRDRELERLIQILNRRTKNNPALIGEPGVGKTAVMNALAIKIAQKDVPQRLANKEVYLLDMTAMVAGTQFRGQFEARMKGVIDECKSYPNIILAIDELHNIVGGQDHDNSMNAGNMLKPALSNGTLQVIGATTLKEYRKYIEKDSALERRFQPILIEEPSIDDTIEILKGVKKYYEEHHKVMIPDSVIADTVRLADKYIFDRYFPDKAIDLIDEACSRVYLDNKVLGQVENIEEKLKEVEEQIQETEEDIAQNKFQNTDFEKTANLKATECSLKSKLDELNKKVKKSTLTFENVARVVELWTNIPVARLTTSESDKLLNLEENLNKRIIGQKEAVHALSQAILRKRSNVTNIVRPPSFIFVGPTGVGKTQLVKSLAYELFDREDAIIRLDMSEYMESHSVSKLIGSPPGYVGFEDAGYLTEKVRRNPYSIILFDEIEKAHPSVYNILLQILDDGRLTDSQGRTVSFKNTVVILTSNLGTNFKNDGFGFATENENTDKLNMKVEGALKEYFTPEFLNRIDDIVIFNKLSKDNATLITKLLINEYIKELSAKNINITYSDDLVYYITRIGFNDKFGARPLRRAIQKYVEDLISYMYIKGEIKENKSYMLNIANNQVVVSNI